MRQTPRTRGAWSLCLYNNVLIHNTGFRTRENSEARLRHSEVRLTLARLMRPGRGCSEAGPRGQHGMRVTGGEKRPGALIEGPGVIIDFYRLINPETRARVSICPRWFTWATLSCIAFKLSYSEI